jgi:hypothetical protein
MNGNRHDGDLEVKLMALTCSLLNNSGHLCFGVLERSTATVYGYTDPLMTIHDTAILEAALIGYEQQQKAIEAKIEEIRALLGAPAKPKRGRPMSVPGPRKKRKVSTRCRAEQSMIRGAWTRCHSSPTHLRKSPCISSLAHPPTTLNDAPLAMLRHKQHRSNATCE